METRALAIEFSMRFQKFRLTIEPMIRITAYIAGAMNIIQIGADWKIFLTCANDLPLLRQNTRRLPGNPNQVEGLKQVVFFIDLIKNELDRGFDQDQASQ